MPDSASDIAFRPCPAIGNFWRWSRRCSCYSRSARSCEDCRLTAEIRGGAMLRIYVNLFYPALILQERGSERGAARPRQPSLAARGRLCHHRARLCGRLLRGSRARPASWRGVRTFRLCRGNLQLRFIPIPLMESLSAAGRWRAAGGRTWDATLAVWSVACPGADGIVRPRKAGAAC